MRSCLPAAALAAFAPLALSAQVPALDPAGLSQALKGGTWAVIEFGGPACVPCKRMQPVLAAVQARLGAKAVVRNVYLTEHPKVAGAYKVMVMPTQVVFAPGGREVLRHVGYWEQADFLAALAKAGLE